MKGFGKRLAVLEEREAPEERLPYVWQQPGQTRAEALAAAGLPPDAPNTMFAWRAAQ